MSDEELEELYGPAAVYSEHRKGERISFMEEGKTYTGTIIWVCAPGMVGGKKMGIRYIVESDQRTGFPAVVIPGEIIEH